jgi:hypothetical protein
VTSDANSGAAAIQPIFHPVSEKIFPAEPTFNTRSAIPGMVAIGVNFCPSISTCSQTSSAMTTRSCSIAALAITWSSWASNSRPVGLCGLLKRIARVFEVIATASASFSMRHLGGCRAISTGIPPARRIIGA